jgi:poly(A) polymerase
VSAVAERLHSHSALASVRAALEQVEGRAWVVGGTVRDALLGRPLGDLDLAVEGDPERAARAIGRAVGGPAFSLSESFGAWRVIAPEGGYVCDVSPLRGGGIEADLAARDFTVNAMAVPVTGDGLLDPFGGGADATARVLRVLGARAYDEDPLRPLRLARLATELELVPEPETERLTRAAAGRVPASSPERVFAELRRIVIADQVLEGIELCDRLGLLAAVLPEVAALHGVEQSWFHHLDVYGHTMEVLRRQLDLEHELAGVFGELAPRVRSALAEPLGDDLSRGQALRFGALLHDVGKPPTRAVRPDGRVTFIGHDAVGDEMVGATCRRLRTSAALRSFLGAICRHHLVLGFLVHQRPLERRTLYRYLTTCHPVEVEVTVLSCADRLATRGRNAEAAIAAHLDLAVQLMNEALDWREAGPPQAPIRGDELARALGVEPGPELGRLLAELEEAVFAGDVETREEAIEYARRARRS